MNRGGVDGESPQSGQTKLCTRKPSTIPTVDGPVPASSVFRVWEQVDVDRGGGNGRIMAVRVSGLSDNVV